MHLIGTMFLIGLSYLSWIGSKLRGLLFLILAFAFGIVDVITGIHRT
jgi:hypothetical protein